MGILHGVNASPFVRKVRVALKEKGIDYELDPVFPMNQSEEFLKISPLGKIPVYTPQEGVNIPDSSVIIAYLEKTHPDQPLYPSDATAFARALWFEEYGDSALVSACGTVFFQRLVGPRFMGQTTDEAAVRKALEEDLPPILAYMDGEIGAKEFIAGDGFTIGDIGLCSPLVNLMHAGESVDSAKYPNLARYAAGIHSRSSFAELIDEEKATFSQAA
ncbi:MAG: glutathione S-transferase family protein [Candidatus Binatia bacterium]